MASMWEHVTPLTSSPVLENKTRDPGAEGDREERKGEREGRDDLTQATDGTVQLFLLGNWAPGGKPPKGSPAPAEAHSPTSGAPQAFWLSSKEVHTGTKPEGRKWLAALT